MYGLVDERQTVLILFVYTSIEILRLRTDWQT